MQKVQNMVYELESSISSLKIDFELLERLKNEINLINIKKENFEECMKLLLLIYDQSNNQKLFTVKKITISMNQMAVQLKVLVCKLMSMVINYFERQESVSLIPFQILSEGIEIMILCTRVCLNESQSKFISSLQQFYQLIHSPYEYVTQILGRNFQFFHHLNVIELMRFKCQNQSFSVIEFQKRLSLISAFEQFKMSDYKGFIENIVMEIILKLLKSGKLASQNLNSFHQYISQENQKDLQFLIFPSNDSVKNLESSSQFLQIYNQIKNYGIESINFEFLEEFIREDKNFKDERIFEIAALTSEPDLLGIWFNILNSRKEKCLLIQKAFMCFIHISQQILHENQPSNKRALSSLLKLSNTIIFTLLTQKKSSNLQQPILNIIKTLMKVLTYLCFSLEFSWMEMKEFGQRIVLICSRYQCMEVSKVTYTLLLYCSLVRRQKAEDIYEKFMAYYSNQKLSEVYLILSSAYQFQNSRPQNWELGGVSQLQLLKQSFIAILFAQNNEDMAIFEMEMKEFKEMNGKLYVYCQMMKKHKQNEKNICKIIEHLESFLIKASIDEFQNYLAESQQQTLYLQQLFMILIQLLEQKQPQIFNKIKGNLEHQSQIEPIQSSLKQNNNQASQSLLSPSRISFILVNLCILANPQIAKELKQTTAGVLLNKYSMKIKMVNGLIQIVKKGTVAFEIQISNFCSCYLITMLQKLKKSFLKKQRIGEPGQVSFLHAIEELVTVYKFMIDEKDQHRQMENELEKVSKRTKDLKSEKIKVDFIQFIIFQLDCLTNNHQKYLKVIESIPIPQLRVFTRSVYMSKNLKQKILRRIVRQNLMQDGSEITLKQFRQIIEITEDYEELQLYIRYVFCNYGQEGRKMLMLIAHENKQLQKILLTDSDVEI